MDTFSLQILCTLTTEYKKNNLKGCKASITNKKRKVNSEAHFVIYYKARSFRLVPFLIKRRKTMNKQKKQKVKVKVNLSFFGLEKFGLKHLDDYDYVGLAIEVSEPIELEKILKKQGLAFSKTLTLLNEKSKVYFYYYNVEESTDRWEYEDPSRLIKSPIDIAYKDNLLLSYENADEQNYKIIDSADNDNGILITEIPSKLINFIDDCNLMLQLIKAA